MASRFLSIPWGLVEQDSEEIRASATPTLALSTVETAAGLMLNREWCEQRHQCLRRTEVDTWEVASGWWCSGCEVILSSSKGMRRRLRIIKWAPAQSLPADVAAVADYAWTVMGDSSQSLVSVAPELAAPWSPVGTAFDGPSGDCPRVDLLGLWLYFRGIEALPITFVYPHVCTLQGRPKGRIDRQRMNRAIDWGRYFAGGLLRFGGGPTTPRFVSERVSGNLLLTQWATLVVEASAVESTLPLVASWLDRSDLDLLNRLRAAFVFRSIRNLQRSQSTSVPNDDCGPIFESLGSYGPSYAFRHGALACPPESTE